MFPGKLSCTHEAQCYNCGFTYLGLSSVRKEAIIELKRMDWKQYGRLWFCANCNPERTHKRNEVGDVAAQVLGQLGLQSVAWGENNLLDQIAEQIHRKKWNVATPQYRRALVLSSLEQDDRFVKEHFLVLNGLGHERQVRRFVLKSNSSVE